MQKQYCQKHRGRKQRECKQDREEEQEDGGAISSLIAPHGGWGFSLQQWRQACKYQKIFKKKKTFNGLTCKNRLRFWNPEGSTMVGTVH